MLTPARLLIQPFWEMATWWGIRRLTQSLLPACYSDTIFHGDTQQPVIALTMDDGLVRGSPDKSLASQVLDCLDRYQAHATFFVCTDYLKGQDEQVAELLKRGHELGNHLEAEKSFHYNRLEQEEFRQVLRKTNAILKEVNPSGSEHRWFRAPQGILTTEMAQVLRDEGIMTHVLGDCYCDDWRFAREVDGLDQDERQEHMQVVADILLSQVQPGSIAILHMPEVGFREGILDALELFLQGLQKRGYRCVNLTELQEIVASEPPKPTNVEDSMMASESSETSEGSSGSLGWRVLGYYY